MKKTISLFLSFFPVIFLLILMSFGCKTETSEDTTIIEFWTAQTQTDRQATIQLLIDSFHAQNPKIEVKLIAVNENDLPTQIQTSLAAGTLPAIAEIGSENAVAFGSQGILDKKAATEFINSIGRGNFYAGVLKLVESATKGEYFSVPFHGWVQGIWYRADWFKKAGLKPPTTWKAIETAAKYFYNPKKNIYGILIGTKAGETYNEQCFTQIAMSNDAGLFDKRGKLIFNSSKMKQAVKYYTNLAKYTPPGPQTWRGRDYYMQGKLAMFFYSTYIMDDLAIKEEMEKSLTSQHFKELAGAEYDPNLVHHTRLAPIITNKKQAGYGVVDTVGFFKQKQSDALRTEAAKKFLSYLFTPDVYITYIHMAPGGMNPVIKHITKNDRFLNDPKGIFRHYGKDKIEEIVQGLEKIETFSMVDGTRMEAASIIFSKQIIPQMIYKVTQEGMNIEKAMSWAEIEMKKITKSQ